MAATVDLEESCAVAGQAGNILSTLEKGMTVAAVVCHVESPGSLFLRFVPDLETWKDLQTKVETDCQKNKGTLTLEKLKEAEGSVIGAKAEGDWQRFRVDHLTQNGLSFGLPGCFLDSGKEESLILSNQFLDFDLSTLSDSIAEVSMSSPSNNNNNTNFTW